MNVTLTPELEEFIEHEVQAGVYPSASEAIRAGLRRLKDEKQARPRFVVASSEELENKLLDGIRQLERGEGLPGELAAQQLRERAQARRQRNG